MVVATLTLLAGRAYADLPGNPTSEYPNISCIFGQPAGYQQTPTGYTYVPETPDAVTCHFKGQWDSGDYYTVVNIYIVSHYTLDHTLPDGTNKRDIVLSQRTIFGNTYYQPGGFTVTFNVPLPWNFVSGQQPVGTLSYNYTYQANVTVSDGNNVVPTKTSESNPSQTFRGTN